MRLYGRQSRARARRRRVLLEPRRRARADRDSVRASRCCSATPWRTACASRACRWAERRGRRPSARSPPRSATQLQREVTVTVAGRSATLSPYDLGVRVDAPRTARAALDCRQGARRPALLGRVLALDRSRAALSRSDLALPAELADRDAVAGRCAPGAQAERRRHRRPGQAGCRLRSRRGPARDHGRRARRSQRACRCARCPRRLRSRPRPRAAPRLASRSCCRRRSPSRAAARPAGKWPVRRLAPLLSATTYRHVIGVQFDPQEGRRGAATAALRLPSTGQGRDAGGRGRPRARALVAERHRSRRAHHGTPSHDARAVRTERARTAALAFRVTQPELTTSAARALGATDVVSTATTSLGDSSENRVFNVELLAQLLDGTIVKPGATFSFNTDGRPAHRGARVQGGPGDRERRARAVHRRRRLPGRDDGLRRGLLRAATRSRIASTTPSTSRTTRSGWTRRWPTTAPTSRS